MELLTLRDHKAPASASVRPRDLLDDSERLYDGNLVDAIGADPDPGEAHRRELLLQALAAYERLRLREAPDSDPGTVFAKWPACTLIATAWLARRAEDLTASLAAVLGGPATGWLAGWAHAWAMHPELRGHIRSPGLTAAVRASGAVGSVVAAPLLRLDLERGALVVAFPDERHGASVLVGGGECPRAGNGFLLARPSRIATCTDVLGGVHVVDVVDITDPLIVFDETGARLPAGAALPAGEVWVLHLGTPTADAVDGTWQVLEHATPPVGWSRWWLARVSLAGAAAIRSAVDFGPPPGPWRPVQSTAQADLLLGEPIEGLLGPDGEPVHGEPPRLRLPGGASQTWTVELLRDGAALPRRWTAFGGAVVSLADGSTGPLVGRFRVAASAPGHSPVRASVTLAQGVSLTARRRLRLLRESGGLTSADVRLSAPAGVLVPSVVSLKSIEMRTSVTIRAADSTHRLDAVVELPHCALRRRVAGENGVWGIRPEAFTLDDLAHGACLDVQLPARLREALGHVPALVATDPAGGRDQLVRGARVADGVYRYRLAELLDSVRSDGSLALSLVLGDGFTAQVARIRGSAVAEAVLRRGDELRLVDRDPAPELVVRVTSPLTPWLRPWEVTVAPGESAVPLGPGYVHGGLLDVRVGAPHLASRTDRSFRIGDPNRVPTALSGVEFQAAAYLAGQAPPPTGIAAYRLLWAAADAGGPATDAGSRALVTQECAAVLGERPYAALVAGARTAMPAHRTVPILVRSGLAAHRFARVDRPEAITLLWESSPLLSLLLTSPLLPYRSGAVDWSPAELSTEEALLLDAAERYASPAGLDILTGERRWDGPVPPKPLLDVTDAPSPAATTALTGLDELRAFAHASAFGELFSVLTHVRAPRASSPREVSLGFAIVARLAAHGDPDAAEAEPGLRVAWLAVVAADPGTAASDLALAEYLVSHWHAHRA